MAKKAKWLEEGTEVELLEVVLGVLGGDLDKKEINKATKAVEELIERAPTGDEEELSVEDSIEALKELFTTGIENITVAYNAELEAISGDTSDEDDEEEDAAVEDEDDEEEANGYDEMTLKELKAECKEKGIKGLKGLKKEDLIALLTETEDEAEDTEEDDEDSEEVEDYSEISQKELKEMCRERGIKVTKAMKKADFIKALEADDAE